MTGPPAHDCPGAAAAASVAGLAREVEHLRRQADRLARLPSRVDELADLVTCLADTVHAGPAGGDSGTGARSWLEHSTDPPSVDGTGPVGRAAAELLTDLTGWVAAVYLRYSDAQGLPDRWLWHPDIVEELHWLHAAWRAAHHRGAPPTAVGDWHDRQRPGVTRRVHSWAGYCSLDNHRPGSNRHATETDPEPAEAVEAIAAWWTGHRDSAPPAPSEDQLAVAAARARARSRR